METAHDKWLTTAPEAPDMGGDYTIQITDDKDETFDLDVRLYDDGSLQDVLAIDGDTRNLVRRTAFATLFADQIDEACANLAPEDRRAQ